MGRKKLTVKKIENPTSRQVTYSKRKDAIVKKASELSVLCDTDVGLIMFSPTGRLTCFASKGRVESIFLRYIDRPHEFRGSAWTDEYFYQSLVRLKNEGEMLEKIEKIEALEEKLNRLNQQQHEAQYKIRFYDPDLEKITSVHEAQVYQQFLMNGIQHIEQLKAKLLGNQIAPQKPESIEVPAVDIDNAYWTAEASVESNRMRNPSRDGHRREETFLPFGPHLSLSYLKMQNHWNLPGGSSGGQ